MKRVALLIETANQSGRDILMGVGQYAAERNHWDIFHHPGGLNSPWRDWLEGWEGDGVICRVHGAEMIPFLRSLEVPVVDTFHNHEAGNPFPYVHLSEEKVGALGAAHLIDRGFRHFAFVSVAREPFPVRRFAGFRKAVEAAGFPEPDYVEVDRNVLGGNTKRVADWLLGLPLPVGVMICSDIIAVEVYTACRAADLSIPSEVALVSVDNDEVQTRLLRPPLTSIDANHGAVGYEAARLLDDLMAEGDCGADDRPSAIEFPPLSVRVRQSSDTRATTDPIVAKAVGFIQEHACEKIGNDLVARAAGASRSVLQRKFQEELGKSVHRLIIEERLARVRALLEETDLPIIEVADICGYDSQQSLNRACTKEWGESPGAIRRGRS